MWKIRHFFEARRRKKWIKAGKPMTTYDGFNCGCCGKWVNEEYKIPAYLSMGRWWDTWGLCDRCAE